MKPRYDSIVIGAGAGGGIAAALLAESGRSVLLIDRGPHETYASAGHRDHLRNQRISTYGHNAGPDIDGNPRVAVDAQGTARTVAPHEAGYQNNAAIVGGGTFVYGGQAWRFLPKDFRMASSYGVPAGSSLTDWPFPYDDLAPWYERAEWEIGVAGDSPGSAAIWPRAPRLPDAAGAARPRRRGAPARRGSPRRVDPHPAAAHQHRAARRPRRLHRVRLLRRLSLPDRRQERHPEHHAPPRARHRRLRARHLRHRRAHHHRRQWPRHRRRRS